jgi:hypothetical protein
MNIYQLMANTSSGAWVEIARTKAYTLEQARLSLKNFASMVLKEGEHYDIQLKEDQA